MGAFIAIAVLIGAGVAVARSRTSAAAPQSQPSQVPASSNTTIRQTATALAQQGCREISDLRLRNACLEAVATCNQIANTREAVLCLGTQACKQIPNTAGRIACTAGVTLLASKL